MAEFSDFKYWPVNWVDGMLLNKDMLSHQDLYHSERLADAVNSGLTPFNYGILQRHTNSENCIVTVSVDNRTSLKINIQKCQAITSGGMRISIPGEDWELDEIAIDLKEIPGYSKEDSFAEFFVVLNQNPKEHVECGTPDPEEEPQRYPYTRPHYSVSIVPAKTLDKSGPGPNALPVALLTVNSGEFKQSETYVPPCNMVQSHSRLTGFVEQLQLSLRSLENSSIDIMQKVRSKHQENQLALGINSLAEQILDAATGILSFLNVKAKYMPVVDVMVMISTAARSIKNKLDTWQGIGKEEVMNYLAEWCSLNQGEFEKNLNELIAMDYKHQNMMPLITISQGLFSSLAAVFTVLADLDYIGKKIDTDLFVKEDVMAFEEETVKSKKSGLFRK